jgi:hypothetical protein
MLGRIAWSASKTAGVLICAPAFTSCIYRPTSAHITVKVDGLGHRESEHRPTGGNR